jgi:transcriptional regulator with XRE-family HTH domain
VTKTAFMRWVDGQIEADPRLAKEVDELLNEMKIEQELVALRERRGLSQRQAAEMIQVSQPYIAKLESGRVKNLGVGTLLKYAHALGGSVSIEINAGRVTDGLRAHGASRAGRRPSRVRAAAARASRRRAR